MAIVNDTIYGGSQIGILVVLVGIKIPLTLQIVMLASCSSLLASAAVSTITYLRLPTGSLSSNEERTFSSRYALESVVVTGGGQITQLVVSGLLGLTFAAGIRGAQLFFGPLALLLQTSRLILVPRFAKEDAHNQQKIAAMASAALSLGVILWSLLLLPMYTFLGPRILGQSSGAAEKLLVPMAAVYVAQSIYYTHFFVARAQGHDRTTSQARLVQMVSLATGTALACILHSGIAYVAAMAIASLAAAFPIIHSMRRVTAPSVEDSVRGEVHS
jgi:hypothetical protein